MVPAESKTIYGKDSINTATREQAPRAGALGEFLLWGSGHQSDVGRGCFDLQRTTTNDHPLETALYAAADSEERHRNGGLD